MRNALLLFVLVACSACSTRYKSWHGGGVEVGGGGACEQIAGVDVWSHGRPNRPYRVIGIIEDKRPGGIIPMAQRAGSVAREAKRKGGDGVIIVNESKEYRGSFTSMNAFATSNYNSTWTGYRAGNLVSLSGTGTATTVGTGSAVTMPVFQARGLYQVIKYAGESGGASEGAIRATTREAGGRLRTDSHGTSYLE